jgi:glycosyltransferase involved in cell wall biosynthesis
LVALLDALSAQTLPIEEYEVIVVDDFSTDETAHVARASPLSRVIDAPARGGAYAARNLGVAASSADVLAFTDADCVPAPTWLEHGLAALARSRADLAAGHIEIPLDSRASASALVDFARYLNQERAAAEGFGVTANLFVRRAVFDRIGLFNGKLVSGGDTEFGHRARAAGFALVLAAEAVVVHPARSTPRELARKAYRLGFGAAQQIRHADGPMRHRNHICKHVGAYAPSWGIPGMERLEQLGLRLGIRRRLAMESVNYFFVNLPIVIGNIHGTLYERRRAEAA